MNCRKARAWISRELDGELAPRRQAVLRAHLDSCPGCRAVRDEWARIGAELRDRTVPQAQAPEAAWADVRRAIRLQGERKQPVEWGWIFGVPVRAAAVIVLVVALGAGVFLAIQKPSVSAVARPARTEVETVETGLPGATPMVYEDAGTGLTVIWVVEQNGRGGGHAGS